MSIRVSSVICFSLTPSSASPSSPTSRGCRSRARSRFKVIAGALPVATLPAFAGDPERVTFSAQLKSEPLQRAPDPVNLVVWYPHRRFPSLHRFPLRPEPDARSILTHRLDKPNANGFKGRAPLLHRSLLRVAAIHLEVADRGADTPDFLERSSLDQPTMARAARSCAGVITCLQTRPVSHSGLTVHFIWLGVYIGLARQSSLAQP